MESSKKKNIIIVVILLLILLIVGFILFSNNSYTVTIDGNGAIVTTSSKEVKKGTTIGDIEVPTREGYKFLYWTLDGKPCKESDEITEDIKLVAVWESEKPKYVVKFNTDGGNAIVEQKVEEGTVVIKPTDPTKEGYKFLYWQLDGKVYDFSSQITKDIILTAKWEKVEEQEEDKEEETTKKYTVTFKDGSKTLKTVSVEEEKTVSKITTPTKSGYKFVKWQLNGKDYNFGSKVTKDITLTAVWEKVVTYTVKFDTAGGSSISSKKVEENKTVSKPKAPTKSGYVFVKWQLNGKDYDFGSKVTKNITLKAVYREAKKYTVTFKDGDKVVTTKTVVEGNKVSKPSNPTKSGYTFSGWLLNGKSYDFSKTVTKNLTLTAKWKQKSYTVTVTLVDSETNPARKLVVKQGSTVISDAKAIKTTDGVVLDSSAPFTINATIVSKLGSSVKVVLKDGTEVKATLVK